MDYAAIQQAIAGAGAPVYLANIQALEPHD